VFYAYQNYLEMNGYVCEATADERAAHASLLDAVKPATPGPSL
jgi:hypothetical protein